ncbi:MAG: TIM barrel protein [Rhodospirillales bacterium]
MPKFSANLDWLFTDLPYGERFAAAAAAGFTGVECLRPYALPAADVRKKLERYGTKMALINTPPSSDGLLGIAATPGRSTEFLDGLRRAVDYAGEVGSPLVHAVAGVLDGDTAREDARAAFVDNLRAGLEVASKAGITLTIEPINPFDVAGYFLNRSGEAASIIAEIGHPGLRLQLDFYHRQIVEGGLSQAWEEFGSLVAHVQIAGVPGRNEPDTGEINYPHLFALMDRTGYDGWVGCEYRPAGKTLEGLRWAARWGIGLHS